MVAPSLSAGAAAATPPSFGATAATPPHWTTVAISVTGLAIAMAAPRLAFRFLGLLGCLVTLALATGALLRALDLAGTALGGIGTLAGVARLVATRRLRVRGVGTLLTSSTPALRVDLFLTQAGGRDTAHPVRVAGVDRITVAAPLSSLIVAAVDRVVTGTRPPPIDVVIDGLYVDWTHGESGCLRLVELLKSVGMLKDAGGAEHTADTRPAHARDATTTTVVPLRLSGTADVSGLAPLRVLLTRGRVMLPEVVGKALGSKVRFFSAAGCAALDAAPPRVSGRDAWWRAPQPPSLHAVPLALTLQSDTARVCVRAWRVDGGLALARPVTATAAVSDDVVRLMLARLHPFLAAVVSVSAEGGGSAGPSPTKDVPTLPMLSPASLSGPQPAPTPAVRVALWPAGGHLPSPSLDIVLAPLTVAVRPVGVAASLLSTLSLLSLGAGPASAAAATLALSTSTARVTLERGGTAKARRLDVRLSVPSSPSRAVELAVWCAAADEGDPDVLDARVGIPVAALRRGGPAARALAPPGARDDDVVAVRVVGARTPTLDWRAAARELPAAIVGSHVRAAATAAIESRLADAAPWLASAAAKLKERAEAAAAPPLAAPPPEEPFGWEVDGLWGDEFCFLL